MTHERDHRSSPPRSRAGRCARTRAGAPGRRARTGSTPTTRPRARAAPRRRPPATARAAPRAGAAMPNAGHQNTSLCVHAPLSTRLENQPIARLKRAPAAQPAAAPGGERHREREHDDRREQRVRVRLRAERHVEHERAAARRARSAGSRDRGSGTRSRRRRSSRTTNQSTMPARPQTSRGVERRVHQRVGVGVLLARHVLQVDDVVRRRATRAPRACSGRRFACFTFHSPRSCLITSSESARTWMTPRAEGARPPRARRSAPGTRRRCSS